MLFFIVYVLVYPIAISSINSGSLLPNNKLIKRDAFPTSEQYITSTNLESEKNDLLLSSKVGLEANIAELKIRNVTVTLNDSTSMNSINATSESSNELINATTKQNYKVGSIFLKPTVKSLIATAEPSSQTKNDYENEIVTLTTYKSSQTTVPLEPSISATADPSYQTESETAKSENKNPSTEPLSTKPGILSSLILTVKPYSQNEFETTTYNNEIVNLSSVLLKINEITQKNVLFEPDLVVTTEPRFQKEFITTMPENEVTNFSRALTTNLWIDNTPMISSLEFKTNSLTSTIGSTNIFNNPMVDLIDTNTIKIESENDLKPTTEFKNNQTTRIYYNKTERNMSLEDNENKTDDYRESYNYRFIPTYIPIISTREKINEDRSQIDNFTEDNNIIQYDLIGLDDKKPINFKDQQLFLSIPNSTLVDERMNQNEYKKLQGSDENVKNGQVVLDFEINYSFIVSIGSKASEDPTVRKIPSGLCTGSLITPLHVITVSRCFIDSYWDDYEDLRQNYVDKYFVRSGSPKSTSGGNISQIYDIFIHPAYGDTDYGLAILELEKPIYLSRPALSTSLQELYWTNNLEEKQINYKILNLSPGEECELIGWTSMPQSQETGINKDSYVDLRKFNVVLAQWDKCVYEDFPLDGNEMICANTASERSLPCPVSMGSPLLLRGKHVGLAVWSFGCKSTDYPLLFARVDSQVQWIREIVTTAKQFYISQFKASFQPKITLNIILLLISFLLL